MKKERPVVVTTKHRGIFFGYATDTDGETIFLRQGRFCVYWSVDLRGFMGLAVLGPNANCKVGLSADITIRDITSVVEVTALAVKQWEKAPWGK